MDERDAGLGRREDVEETNNAELDQECRIDSEKLSAEAHRARAARAKLIEETTYRLTDLFTIICGRIEILGDKVPSICKEELLAIRDVVTRGVELNRRLFIVAQACRREIGG